LITFYIHRAILTQTNPKKGLIEKKTCHIRFFLFRLLVIFAIIFVVFTISIVTGLRFGLGESTVREAVITVAKAFASAGISDG